MSTPHACTHRPSLARPGWWLILFAIIGLSVLASTNPAHAQEVETYDLRPHWTPGQTARYAVWTSRTQHITVTLAGQSRSTNLTMTSEGEITWTVDKVKPDGSSVCTMTIGWLTLEYIPDDGEILKNDSRKGSGDIESFHALIKAMAGVPIKVSVGPDGTITKVQGVKAIGAKIKPDLKDRVPQDLDFIETATDLAALIAAPQAIQIGKKWKTAPTWSWSDASFEGYMHHDMTFTLAGVEEMAGVPIAVVEGRSKLKLELDRSDLPEDMPPFDIKLVKGELRTQIMFDLSRSEAVGRNSIETTTIDMTVRTPNTTVSRRVEQTLQGQALRVYEE